MMNSPARRALAASMAMAATLHFVPEAQASSEDAWSDFRLELEAACRDVAQGRMDIGAIRIDPFGTESYGVAILREAGSGGGERVCVYDKKSGRAELGGPVTVAASPAEELAPSDARQLRALPDQVRATLDAPGRGGHPLDGPAETVASLLEGDGTGDGVSGIEPGPYACNVYWYGFLDDAVRHVGTHQCAVERRDDGELTIRKFTGERLNARTLPLDGGRIAFAGRKFLAGHRYTEYDPASPDNPENDNFGNKVGLVMRSGERLLLVSVDERGMSPPDPTFFEVLELVPER